ncbi:hypothetical protein SELMODRAFT_110768 [Selaginella moellendorffii]|uniref:Probable quinone oxidoreductase n=2 Tax=Selaginella moellendorffii TaxID=88036 RepID=D8S843_SELML|nr:hypothetical protein SELMODRAFT_110768 [Selaginella moellendorffii]
MVKGIKVYTPGGPEVLKYEELDVGEPGEGQVKIRIKAVGLNFIDVYFRKGAYGAKMPYVPGFESAGEVIAIGPGVTDAKVGDKVGCMGAFGAYAEEQIVPARALVPIPESVDFIKAGAILLKGMTAQMLLRKTFKVGPEHTILVHAAAGGVGSLLCQWARSLGAQVIGCVSNEEKARQATEDGCHHVIIYSKEDFGKRVMAITNNSGVHVVYDSVGRDTFQGSLDCLATRGYMISYGQSSGAPDPFTMSILAPKSLFLTRPSLIQYTTNRDELLEIANDLFHNVEAGVLKVRVNQTYPLSDAAKAHDDIENRRTTGSTVLIP